MAYQLWESTASEKYKTFNVETSLKNLSKQAVFLLHKNLGLLFLPLVAKEITEDNDK